MCINSTYNHPHRFHLCNRLCHHNVYQQQCIHRCHKSTHLLDTQLSTKMSIDKKAIINITIFIYNNI